MTARILSGLDLAGTMMAELAPRVAAATAGLGRPPRLVLLGDLVNGGARAYADRQAAFGAAAGIDVTPEGFGNDPTTAALVARIATLCADPSVDAILPLMPLPGGVDPVAVTQAIDPDRDVDGLTALAAGRLALGLPGFAPCTAEAAIRLAEAELGDLSGRDVAVVGASPVVGKPLALMLMPRGATVTVCQITTRDLAASTRSAELVFVAVGKPGLIGAAHLRPGAVVIDIGINRVIGPDGAARLVGDVDLPSAGTIAAAISAVPDGVGPITTACLMRNVVAAAEARLSRS